MGTLDRFERAVWWLAQGAELVPLQPRSKHLVAGFGAHQQHITDEASARAWFADRACNIGLVLDGFVCADFDQAEAFESWRAGLGREVSTLIERTARGAHVYWRANGGFVNRAGAGFELKASGVAMVAPSVHPTGMRYEVFADASVASLSFEHAATLFSFISKPSASTALMKEKVRHAVVPTLGGLVKQIKGVWRVEDEAALAGIELRVVRGMLLGQCPFHADEHPSLWVNVARQVWGCYAAGCLTNARGEAAHDVINLRAYRRHGGDVRAAIRELAVELRLTQEEAKRA